jgi:hypothetical protein
MKNWTSDEYLYDMSGKIFSAMVAVRLLDGDVTLVNEERLARYAVGFARALLQELEKGD